MTVLSDANNLYDAAKRVIKCSSFKHQTQSFEMNLFLQIKDLQQEIESGTYSPKEKNMFYTNERGKVRHISSENIRDKVVERDLCDRILTPSFKPFLAYDNGASQEHKGTAFSRKRFEIHLHEAFNEYGTNKIYGLFGDYKSYYDSIPHGKAIKRTKEYVMPNVDLETWSQTLMIFTRGLKKSDCGFNIGEHKAQEIGTVYPTPVDNFIRNVKGFKYFARHSDDFYVLSDDKAKLLELKAELETVTAREGLTIHPVKTRIERLDKPFRYLQIRYSIDENGRVYHTINPKAVTRERSRLKKYKGLMDKGRMTYPEIENCFKSWLASVERYITLEQLYNFTILYYTLYGRCVTWQKKHTRLRWLMGLFLRDYLGTGTYSPQKVRSREIFQTRTLRQ